MMVRGTLLVVALALAEPAAPDPAGENTDPAVELMKTFKSKAESFAKSIRVSDYDFVSKQICGSVEDRLFRVDRHQEDVEACAKRCRDAQSMPCNYFTYSGKYCALCKDKPQTSTAADDEETDESMKTFKLDPNAQSTLTPTGEALTHFTEKYSTTNRQMTITAGAAGVFSRSSALFSSCKSAMVGFGTASQIAANNYHQSIEAMDASTRDPLRANRTDKKDDDGIDEWRANPSQATQIAVGKNEHQWARWSKAGVELETSFKDIQDDTVDASDMYAESAQELYIVINKARESFITLTKSIADETGTASAAAAVSQSAIKLLEALSGKKLDPTSKEIFAAAADRQMLKKASGLTKAPTSQDCKDLICPGPATPSSFAQVQRRFDDYDEGADQADAEATASNDVEQAESQGAEAEAAAADAVEAKEEAADEAAAAETKAGATDEAEGKVHDSDAEFAALDVNKDGKVTEAEFEAAKAKQATSFLETSPLTTAAASQAVRQIQSTSSTFTLLVNKLLVARHEDLVGAKNQCAHDVEIIQNAIADREDCRSYVNSHTSKDASYQQKLDCVDEQDKIQKTYKMSASASSKAKKTGPCRSLVMKALAVERIVAYMTAFGEARQIAVAGAVTDMGEYTGRVAELTKATKESAKESFSFNINHITDPTPQAPGS